MPLVFTFSRLSKGRDGLCILSLFSSSIHRVLVTHATRKLVLKSQRQDEKSHLWISDKKLLGCRIKCCTEMSSSHAVGTKLSLTRTAATEVVTVINKHRFWDYSKALN